MNFDSMVDNALWYAERNWYVFPCREKHGGTYTDKNGRTKELKPKSPYVRDGFHSATTNPEEIKAWWKKWPNACIGVSCGDSGLLVVDIDVKDGNVGFESFMQFNVSREGALVSLTPSGGMHIIFEGESFSSANKRVGIDIRSQGAYIIAPPSALEYSDGKSGKYVAIEGDWKNLSPVSAPIKLMRSLEDVRNRRKNKNDTFEYPEATHEELVRSAKRALGYLDSSFAFDYFKWLRIGMCLHPLGEDGFKLWVDWSKTCPEKFTGEQDCRDKWDTFKPRDIRVWSLFYHAYGDKQKGEY